MRCEICIVGGGMSGLAAALHLVDLGVPGRHIAIVDQGPAGTYGRVRSVVSATGHIRELGAARYNPTRHPALDDLLARFGVECAPFAYTRRFAEAADPAILARITDAVAALRQDGVLGSRDISLRNALAPLLSTCEIRLLCEWSGYGSLFADTFPVAGALEVLCLHPESWLCTDDGGAWATPARGFSSVARAIEDRLRDAGVRTLHRTTVRAVLPENGYILHCSDGEERRELRASAAIVTTPPSALRSMLHPWSVLRRWCEQQATVPLFKCFADVENPWWPSALDRTLLTGIFPLQKLYLDAARRTVYWYCDSWASQRFARLLADPGAILAYGRELIERELRAAGVADVRLGQAAHLKFWPEGITYPAVGAATPPGHALSLGTAASYASDALTPHIGWIEGALISGRAAAEQILVGPPAISDTRPHIPAAATPSATH